MTAYVLVEVDVHDVDAYETYKTLSTAAAQRYGARFLVRGGEATLLEGAPPPARVVVLEFADEAAARAWYASPEYTDARSVRQAASTGRLVLLPGAGS